MEPDLQFDLLASSLRADTTDLGAFVEALAVKLEGALRAETVVNRAGGGLFSKQKHVRSIVVSLDDNRYELRFDGARVEPTLARAVRGIVLKTERVSLDEWIDGLSRGLAEQAQRSENARVALERLLT